MKRIIGLVAALALLASGIQAVRLWHGEPRGAPGASIGFPQGVSAEALRDAADRAHPADPSRIAGLPALERDVPRRVDLVVDEATIAGLTPRERTDQILDWLLFAAAAAMQPSIETYSQALFDLPAVRHGYLRTLGNLEFGPTRSRYLGDGAALVLVPGGASDAERRDLLGQAADEHRKDRGGAFGRLAVVDYVLDAATGSAILTRRGDVLREGLFSGEYGYHERLVESAADLAAFLSRVDDLTFAARDGSGLVLGGRQGLARRMRNIGVEQIATVWQSERELQGRQKLIDEFDARWRSRSYRTQSERALLEAERDQDWLLLRRRLGLDGTDQDVPKHSGFSLDPEYDFGGLAASFAKATDLLRAVDASGERAPGGPSEADVAASLSKGDIVPFLRLSEGLQAGGPTAQFLSALLQEIRFEHSFQAARYDGALQGTEVGMVLFYTDLLAKLWAINYLDAAPVREIPEFVTGTGVRLAAMYDRETRELPSARLWFGTSSQGFQTSRDNASIFLGRTATRIYTAGSNDLNPGVEVQTSLSLLAPIEWWNNRYAEVARHEPEYERLNQIMKWSMLVGWLNDQSEGGRLAFLGGVEVDRSKRFPAWVRQHPELRFRDWDAIGFLPQGAFGTKTEALPRLRSAVFRRNGVEGQLSGGVSLAERGTFRARAALPRELDSTPLLRANLDYSAARGPAQVLKTYDGAEFRLIRDAPGAHAVASRAKEGLKLRGTTAQLAPEEVRRVAYAESNGARLETRVGDTGVGELRIEGSGNGFRIGWQARELDAGHDLARRLSLAADPDAMLFDPRRIAEAVKLPGDADYAVRLRGGDRWLRLSPETEPRPDISPGWRMRVADRDGSRRTMQLKAMDDGQLHAALSGQGHIVVDGQRPSLLRVALGGPRPGARRVEIEIGQHRIIGYIDGADGSLHILRTVPPERGRALVALVRRIGDDELKAIRAAAGRSTDEVVLVPLPDAGTPRLQVAAQFERRDHRASADTIARDPGAARRALEQQLAAEVRANRGLLEGGAPNQALQHVEELIGTYGNRPELLLQRALVQIERGNLDAAAESARLARAGDGARGRDVLLDEVRGRIEAARALPQGAAAPRADHLRKLHQALEWQGELARRAGSGDVVQPVVVGDRMGLEVRLAETPRGSALAARDARALRPDRAIVYRESGAGLDMIDWSAPIQRSLDQVIAGKLGRVVHLPREDIAQFRPDLVWFPDPSATKTASAQSHWHKLQHVRGTGPREQSCQSETDPRPECKADRRAQGADVYLVLAADAAD